MGDQEWGQPTLGGGDTQGGFAQQPPPQQMGQQAQYQQQQGAFDSGATWDQPVQTFGQQVAPQPTYQQDQGAFQQTSALGAAPQPETTWNQTDATTAAFDAPTAQPW